MPRITQKITRQVRIENYQTDTRYNIEIPINPNIRADQRLLESIIAITVAEDKQIERYTTECLGTYLATALMEDQFMGITIGNTHIMIDRLESEEF